MDENSAQKTVVVHCKREVYDVYIGRGSIWGNLWSHLPSRFPNVTRVRSRDEAIANYRAWIQTQPQLLAQLSKLRGKVLGCYCAPFACHGDVLAELADALPT